MWKQEWSNKIKTDEGWVNAYDCHCITSEIDNCSISNDENKYCSTNKYGKKCNFIPFRLYEKFKSSQNNIWECNKRCLFLFLMVINTYDKNLFPHWERLLVMIYIYRLSHKYLHSASTYRTNFFVSDRRVFKVFIHKKSINNG